MIAYGKGHIAVLKPQIVPIGIAESMLAGVGTQRDIGISSLFHLLIFYKAANNVQRSPG